MSLGVCGGHAGAGALAAGQPDLEEASRGAEGGGGETGRSAGGNGKHESHSAAPVRALCSISPVFTASC